jgi:RNA-directed DNA polymerase
MWNHFRIGKKSAPEEAPAIRTKFPPLEVVEELPGKLKDFGGDLPLGRANAAKILRRVYDPYTTLSIPKKNGSTRHISAPMSDLKKFQTLILRKFLSGPEVAHQAAFAYIKGKSAVQCARIHEYATWAIKVDIKNFFESIDEKQVYWAFRSRGVSNFRAFFLARFTTRLERQPFEVKKSLRERFSGIGTPALRKYKIVQRHKLLKKFNVERRRIGYVPQGSPTSGQISNLVFYPLDVKLASLAKSLTAKYTRYADDIVISFKSEFTRSEAESALRSAANIINEGGFQLNHSKTRVLKPGSRMQVLGVLIGSPGLRVPPSKKKYLDRSLRAVEKFGFEKHAEHLEETRSYAVLNQLHGFLVWANEVEPGWASPRLIKLSELAEAQLNPEGVDYKGF